MPHVTPRVHAVPTANRRVTSRQLSRILCYPANTCIDKVPMATIGLVLTDDASKLTTEEARMRGIAARVDNSRLSNDILVVNIPDRRVSMINVDFHGPFPDKDAQQSIGFWSFVPTDGQMATLFPVRVKTSTRCCWASPTS